MAYPEAKLGIEFDGRIKASDVWAKDTRRDNALAALGWVVLRFGSDDVLRRSEELAQRVKATLTRRLRSAAA
jgi:very-short-patch-repair endonuclease